MKFKTFVASQASSAMFIKRISGCVFFFVLVVLQPAVYGQSLPEEIPDSVLRKDLMLCGGNTPTPGNYINPTSFPPNAIKHCNKFDLYFEDVYYNVNGGFNDASSAVDRQNTFCAVIDYITSTLDFSNVPSGNPVRIYVRQSYSATFPAPNTVDWIGIGKPIFNQGGTGLINGYVYDYTVSGTDPNPGGYHGEIWINFDQLYTQMAVGPPTPVTLDFQNETLPLSNCQVDLFSLLLHEMTHTLGWWSNISFNQPTSYSNTPPVGNANNLYFYIDNSIRIGQPAPNYSFINLLNSGILNTAAGAYANNNYWISNAQAPENLPVLSGTFTGTNNPFNPYVVPYKAMISHLDDQSAVYTYRQRISPCDYQEFVMGPRAIKGIMRRAYTKGELKTLLSIIGYNPNPAINGSPVITNHIPYSTKMIGSTFNTAYLSYSPPIATNWTDGAERVPVDYTIINNTGTSQTINLAALPANIDVLVDADNDPISVMQGTLVNFRGCGNTNNGVTNGNNHQQLTLSSNGQIITYTPRPNFYGKAQFGFNLWDGKEKGAFVVFTINVLKGTNVSLAANGNMILNGDFEEGSEVRRPGTEESILNGTVTHGAVREGVFWGCHFSDSHPYRWLSNFALFGSGVGINKAQSNCSNPQLLVLKEDFGIFTNDFQVPLVGNAQLPLTGNGQRYQIFKGNSGSFYYLNTNPQYCKKYILEFDVRSSNATTVGALIGYGFTDDNTVGWQTITGNNAYNPPLNTGVTNLSVTGTNAWAHYSAPLYYCSNQNSNVLFLRYNSASTMLLDNLSLKEDLTPTVLNLTQSTLVNCQSVQLQAGYSPLNPVPCGPVTYSWSPATGLSNPNIASPVCTPPNSNPVTYTCTLNTGCTVLSKQITVQVFQSPPVSVVQSGTTCNPVLSVTPANPCYNYSWTGPSGPIPGNTASINPTFGTGGNGIYTVQVPVSPNSPCNGTTCGTTTIPYNLTTMPQGPTVCCLSPVPNPALVIYCNNCNVQQMIASASLVAGATVTTSSVSYNGTIVIDGTFTVNTPFSFINCPKIRFGPNAAIHVNVAQTFDIDNSVLKSACNQMWTGINTNNGASLNTGTVINIDNSTISDMSQGVFMLNEALLNCTYSRFVNNYQALWFWRTPQNYAGIIKGNEFRTTQPFNLLPPYQPGQKGQFGILVQDSKYIQIGGLATMANSPALSTEGNKFTDLVTGIKIELGTNTPQSLTYGHL